MSVTDPPAPPPADEAFWQAWDEFFAALRRARGRAARELDGGLTISQYHLLCAVERAPDAGLRELAEQVGSSPPTATRMLGSLKRGGLIERGRGSDRRLQVRLTDRGADVLAAKRAVIGAKRAAVLATLSSAERRQAERLLPRLTDALEAL